MIQMLQRSEDRAVEFLFAGGGTGGHVFPGIAVAEALRRRCPRARVTFVGTRRPIDRRCVPAAGFDLVATGVQPLPSRPWRLPRFAGAFGAAAATARKLIRRRRPRSVLGLGGYASVPPVWAARRAGVPVAMLNIDRVPGKANKMLARMADRIWLQWPESARFFEHSRRRLAVTGCPIRRQIYQEDRAAARAHLGLSARRRVLLVTGASQGARSINLAVLALLDRLEALTDRWQIIHVTGTLDFDRVSAAYAGRRITHVVVDFADRMGWLYAVADVVIGRAGASSLAEFAATHLPAVLMPYPYHGDHHQRLNAEMLARRGAAVIVDDQVDPQRNAPRLWAALGPLLTEPARLERMAAAARAMGTRDAADRIAEQLCTMAGVS